MEKPKEPDWAKLKAIIDKHRDETWALIPLLQDIQEVFGYIPEESIETIAEGLNLFPSQVQGVISFYAGLSLKPKGRHIIRVCRGTACHVKGGRGILRFMKKELGLSEGETSPDFQFTFETVACRNLLPGSCHDVKQHVFWQTISAKGNYHTEAVWEVEKGG
jgi:NADH:ubiquinone oxidoreductase subunit E